MKHGRYLPSHWQEWLKENGPLTAGVFEFKGVKIWFDDGSKIHWRYAMYVIDPERKELAVFTEHNLYHVYDLKCVRQYKSQGKKHKGMAK
jgi:hypothetical protein